LNNLKQKKVPSGKSLPDELIFVFLAPQQTPVYVYYESLCPDSQAFITKQLYPSMKMLKDHVDLHLIPYGKSTHLTQGSDTIFTW